MEVAKTGKGIEEESGAVFDVTKFQLDYLTTPSGLLDIGIDLTKVDITTRTRPADELYIIAYPHFNVNGKSAAECTMPLEQADSQTHFQCLCSCHEAFGFYSKQSVPHTSYVGSLLDSAYSCRAWWELALLEPASTNGMCSACLSGRLSLTQFCMHTCTHTHFACTSCHSWHQFHTFCIFVLLSLSRCAHI